MNYEFDNERPIYIQLVEKLRIEIITGHYKPGERLPSVRELSLKTRVNPNTMQKALSELENDLLIYTERTNGKYITNDIKLIEQAKKNLAQDKVYKYLTDMSSIGIDYEEAIKYLKELGGNK